MTPAQRSAVEAYLATLAPALRLGHWTIELAKQEPEDREADAVMLMNQESDHATLYVANGLLDDAEKASPEYQRRVFVHELLHLHRARTDMMVEHDLGEIIGMSAQHAFWSGYRRLREVEIDAMAKAIAEHFPLPAIPCDR